MACGFLAASIIAAVLNMARLEGKPNWKPTWSPHSAYFGVTVLVLLHTGNGCCIL